MNSRMDKYKHDNPELKKRTEIKAKLYANNDVEPYTEIDLNSNVSVLKGDGQNIDIDKIREMLDKKYRENIPRRKSINIIAPVEETEDLSLFDTKEYNINEILAKAKTEQCVDYLEERLKKINNTNNDILANLNIGGKNKDKTNHFDNSDELMDLINTVTQLEKNSQKNYESTVDDLLDLNPTEKIPSLPIENSFFTGNLMVTDKDFEDFKDIQKDIKSNSILIKILVTIFVLLLIALGIYMLNDYLNLELFF